MKIYIKKRKTEHLISYKEKHICDFISVYLVSLFVVNVSEWLEDLIGLSQSTISIISKLFIVIFFVRIIPCILRRVTNKMIIVVIVCGLLTLTNMLFFPQNMSQFIDTAITFYTMCFTCFLGFSIIKDFTMVKESIIKSSRIIAIIAILFLIMNWLGYINMTGYSMGLGYACVVPILSLVCSFAERKSVYDFLGMLGLLITIILYGSRGPFLAMALFGVFFLIRYLCANKKYLLCICLCVLLFLVLIFYQSILQLMVDILGNWGIGSRTLYLLAYNLEYDSGRGDIYSLLLDEISNNLFRIRGINAEYSVVGAYAHNIFIELIYQFGIVIGGVAIVFLVSKFLKTLFLQNYSDKNLLRWIFFFASIPQLMISSSLWTNVGFWMWFAMII